MSSISENLQNIYLILVHVFQHKFLTEVTTLMLTSLVRHDGILRSMKMVLVMQSSSNTQNSKSKILFSMFSRLGDWVEEWYLCVLTSVWYFSGAAPINPFNWYNHMHRPNYNTCTFTSLTFPYLGITLLLANPDRSINPPSSCLHAHGFIFKHSFE